MYKHLKRILALALAAMLLMGCAAVASAAAPEKKKLTVILYLCGSDLESDNGQATGDLGKILQSRYNTSEVNVIALAGGARSWRGGYSKNELTVVNVSGRRPTVVETWPVASMSDPDTLSRFLTYCHEGYPAEQYILVMWNHGGGPIHGLMQDQIYGSIMSMPEFVSALDNSPFKQNPLDLLMMNACLMGSAEVGLMVAPYAKYLVASQDSCYGLSYTWLAGVENDPSILETGKRIVDTSFVHNQTVIHNQNAAEKNSIALIDLSKMPAVEHAMDAYFPQVSAQLNDTTFTRMSAQRRDSVAFGVTESGGFKGYDLVDLGDLVTKTQTAAPAEGQALLAALDDAVIYCRHDDDAGCTGLTVYHPFANKNGLTNYVAIYNDLDVSAGYTDYMHRFVAYLTGTPLAKWTNLTTGRASAEKAERTLFNMALTDEQAAHYGDSRLETLLQHEDGTYTLTFTTTKTQMEDSALRGEFAGNALYAVAADGTILSPAIDYTTADDMYFIPAELTREGEDGAEDAVHQALILCSYDAATRQLIPCRVQIWDEVMNAYTGAMTTSFSDYDSVKLTLEYRQETRNAEGTLLPFEQWTIVRTEEWTSAIDDTWAFTLVDDTLDTASLYATFQICDSQNNLYNSDLLCVKVQQVEPGVVQFTYDDSGRLLLEDNTITLAGGQLMLNLNVRNIAEQETVFTVNNLVINGVSLTAKADIYGSGDNWGLMKDEVQYALIPISLEELAGVTTLTSISFDLVCLDAATNETLATIPVTGVLNLDLSSAK
ncbi:MAG: hypothetical protein IKL25_00575 [Clostridia bacterium]|nr:hypothetical protein [Clostridia bacterium]